MKYPALSLFAAEIIYCKCIAYRVDASQTCHSPCEVINILAWYAKGYRLLWFSFELQNTDAITIRDGNVTESLLML